MTEPTQPDGGDELLELLVCILLAAHHQDKAGVELLLKQASASAIFSRMLGLCMDLGGGVYGGRDEFAAMLENWRPGDPMGGVG